MESNYGRGGVTSNEDVLRNFCTNTNEVKANNLSTHYDNYNDQVLLRQYGVLIATRKGDKVMITSKRFSVTTSKVQNELLRIAMEYGLDVQKTNEFAKGGMSRKCELGDNVYVKSKGLSGIVARVNGESCYVKFGGNLSKHDGTYNMNDLKIEESSLFMDDYAKGGEVGDLKRGDVVTLKKDIKATYENYIIPKGTKMILRATPPKTYGNGWFVYAQTQDRKYDVHIEKENFVEKIKKLQDEYAKGGKIKSLNDGLEVYAENDLQLKVIQDIIPILDKKGIKLRFAVKVGKLPQSIIFDNHYRDSALVIPGKGYESEYLPVWYGNEFQDAYEFENLQTNPAPYLPNLDDTDEYAKGGDIAQGNYEMMLSQAKEVEHHVNELQNILQGEKDIDAWVVAKMENVSSTLSDITHYLDGKTEYADGGYIYEVINPNHNNEDYDIFVRDDYYGKWRKYNDDALTNEEADNLYSELKQSGDYYDIAKEIAYSDFLERFDDEEEEEEYAKGGIFESDDDDELYKGEMVNRLPVYEIDLINSVKYKEQNGPIYYRASLDIQQYVSKKLAKRRFGSQDELFAYMGDRIYGVSNPYFSDNWDEESFDIKIIIPRDKKMKEELMTYILEDIKPKYNLRFKVRTKLSTVGKSYHYAKGGKIKSKTNKKMATKKTNDGQTAPQIKRWLFAGSKGGYNYYNIEKRPYKKPVDEEKKGAPVGYRFSKYAEEKGITNNRFRKPTKAEVQQYAGKKKNGKLIMYRETRSNKSDVNPKKKI